MAPTKATKQAGGGQDPENEEPAVLYTLPDLVSRLGKATEAEIHDYVEGHTKADLIAEGAKIGTGRIDTDCARLYGQAADFFEHATPKQRANLVGVSPRMLRAAVSAAVRGSELAAARQGAKSKSSGEKNERFAEAESLRQQARTRRNLLRTGVRALAAGSNTWHAAIESAVKSADSAKNVSDALDALVAVGRRMLRRPAPPLKERLAESGLTTALLDESAKLAEEARGAGDAAEAVMSKGSVSQADVDYWDGINLVLVGTFIDVFDAGHDADPTIPRLVPIALRNYFRPNRANAKKPQTPAPGEPPATPA